MYSMYCIMHLTDVNLEVSPNPSLQKTAIKMRSINTSPGESSEPTKYPDLH